MDAQTAGRAARSLDLLHSIGYFVPEVESRFVDIGLEPGRMTYFAGRSASMGAVGSGVVASTFYNFNPEVIEAVIPRAWSLADPKSVVEARVAGVGEAYTRILGEDVTSSPEMAEAAQLVAIAVDGIPGPEGRPLYAGHADLEWPEAPHLVFWHGLTLLREYRGDGHIAALQTAGLSGREALVTHTATGIGFATKFARTRRGWSQEQWDVTCGDLRDRELLDSNGALTQDGIELREVVEDLTDELALQPWSNLGAEGVGRLLELAQPWRDTVLAAGVFPDGIFGPRHGSSR
ncbi:hypothetical protein [Rhodococcus sp. NPDC058521]|uniref:SCO6745 family protein n=1 Tax=Rhodococcus sp. NPDC058521 TaxID=3346536 RepID=UPI00364B368D